MTALQVIIKEAKAIRKKNPKMEWKKAVAQASAIYASKHKGKSPVGKKHPVKKKVAKKKAVGVIKKKVVRKTATKKAKRKPTEKTVYKAIKKAVSVQKAHMSGIGAVNKHALKKYEDVLNNIHKVERHILEYTRLSKDMGYNLDNRKSFKLSASKWKKYLSELKTHAKELKKHI